MLSVVDDNWFTRMSKRMLLRITPNRNYLIKALLGDVLKSYTMADVLNYKPMTCSR
jgi:hypothetical protein